MTEKTYTTPISVSVTDASPFTVYDDYAYLYLSGGTPDRYAFIWFPMPVQLGHSVSSAILRLVLYDSWSGGPHTITARRIEESWSDSMSGSSLMALDTSASNVGTEAVSASAGTVVEVDVTAMISDVAAGAPWFGVRLALDTSTARRIYSNRGRTEGSEVVAPQLIVDAAPGVPKPRDLRPSGARAVSLTNPLLSWEYVSAGSPQAEYRVQLHTSTDFTTPAYDSDWTASGLPQHDLSLAGSPPNLVDNTTYFWRVKVRDVAGGESDWSDTAEFIRRTKGTLTITFPAANNDDVEELTPTFTHTFTGRTQQSVQHFLFRRDDGSSPWVLFYSDEPTATTDLSWTPPASAAPSDTTGDFMLRLRVWDTIAREAISNDPAYVQAERVYQIVASGDVDPVTSLAGDTNGPRVDLTWSRAAAPDYYNLVVDGIIVLFFLDPAELSTGGTGYALSYYGATGNEEHVFEVIAIESNKPSDSNPSVTLTPTYRGIWLVGVDDQLEVLVTGSTTVPVAVGEDANVFFPKGRRVPVRIVGAVRGYEGTFQGMLRELENRTAEEYVADLRAIKALAPTKEIRLIYGTRNFPILLGRVTEGEHPENQDIYVVSGEFWQTGEFEIESVL